MTRPYFGEAPRWDETHPATEYVNGWLADEPTAEDLADRRAFAEMLWHLPDECRVSEPAEERPSIEEIEDYINRRWPRE